MFMFLLVASAFAAQDTTVILAEHSRDMTGDGRVERLVLTAQGRLTDSLKVTLSIAQEGRVLFGDTFVVDRSRGFDAERGVVTDAGWELRLGYYRDFFADLRFTTPRELLEERSLDPSLPPAGVPLSPRTWRALLESDRPVLKYSPGGDASRSIVWHEPTREFVDMHPCC